MRLSKKIRAITPSVTLAITAKANQMKSEGADVVGFGAGEPDFDTPAHIRDAAKEALDRGYTRYTPASGTMELRRAVAGKLLRENGLAYEPAQIVVSNGAKHSLFNVFQALLDPGDEVLVPAPYWVSYPELVRMADGVPVFVPTREEDGFRPDPGELARAVTPRTRAIIINNPCNPTGALYARGDLEAVAALAVEKDICVVSDEVYEKLSYADEPPVSIAALGEAVRERTVVVNGVSKTYAMTGWRIGYAAAPLPVAKAMGGYQSHAASNPNTVAQYAALAALNGPQEAVGIMAAEFRRRRDRMVARIGAIPGLTCVKPEGAFYVMMNISGVLGRRAGGKVLSGAMDFTEALLESAGVAVVPGDDFGAGRHVRLSYAVSMADIDRGMDRVASFVDGLE